MSKLAITLFGKFNMRCDIAALLNIESRKAQELFSYLLLYRNQPHCRETLAGLLWGNIPAWQSKKYLRHALWQLQTALILPPASHNPILIAEAEWIQINPSADLWLDVAAFEHSCHLFQGVSGQDLNPSLVQLLCEAIQLYQGDLMEGCYEDWCLYERERLQNMYLTLLDKASDYYESKNEPEVGLTYAMQLLRYDNARERTHRRLMRLYYLAGDRTAALRQYERCRAALNKELGVKPSQRTLELYETIRADMRVDATPLQEKANFAPTARTTGLREMLEHLNQFHTNLSTLQRQIQQDIQALEEMLHQFHRL